MADKTLEEFIGEYVANKARSNTKESYESWLRKNGVNSESIYADALKEIDTDYKTSLSTHGSDAEALHRLGLTGSGYSDYLSGKAYSEMQSEKRHARADYEENVKKNQKGYQSYLDAYMKNERMLFEDVIKTMSRDGILDYTTAYRYGVNKGLSDASAAEAARLAGEYTRLTLKSTVMNKIISAALTETQAMEYALGLGLGEDDAKVLGEYAKQIRKYRPSSGN